MTELITAITAAFANIVSQITTLFTDNIASIMTVVGLAIVVAVALKLVKKMKSN